MSYIFDRILVPVLLLVGTSGFLPGQSPTRVKTDQGVQIIDRTHRSRVLGEIRHYRIFLPPGYEVDRTRHYPVVYYFHGWSQRYFGSRPGGINYEQGEDNGGDNIANFVARHPLIVVKWDGFNPRYPGEEYVRPYNIGPVETQRQFPLYFPELVRHVDRNYRTIADREHRGVTGLSMGGFMAFWVGGKYPSLVGSVSNFMGSDEFFVGPGEFPVEYRHTDNFANYLDRHVRLHMGTQDFIRGYHARMNRAWDFVLEHYEHVTYESKHRSAGLSDMLAFHLKAFQDPLARAKTFDHSDVYPEFEVWGWRVETDRHRPGFTLLGNVHAKGFRSVVRQWLPDGPLMNWVRVKVSTGAIYEPGQQYVVTDLDLKQERLVSRRVRSALDGRITWVTDGSLHEVGIVRASASEPVLVLGEHWIQRPGWLESGKSADLFFEIANKGVAPARGVRVQVRPRHRTGICLVKNGDVEIGWIGSGSRTQNKHAIQIEVPGNETDRIALDVEIADAEGRRWIQTLTLEVQRSTGQPPAFEVADGKVFDVLEHGNESNPRFLGRGNGDGIANPGETIVILLRDGDALRMTEARANDPFINPFDQARRFSDYWGKFDHVGSSAKVSELLLSADTPEHYQVPLHLYLLVPDYPEHLTRAERVSLDVRGEDTTPPELVFVEQTPGGVLRAKLRDGARIESVEAAIEGPAFANEHYALELRDDGLGVDAVADDFLFSAYWKPARRDSYPLHLRAEDVKGNVAVFETAVQSVNW